MIDAMLHPEGMTKHITNLEEVAPALLAHLRDDASVVLTYCPRGAAGATGAAAPGQRVLKPWPRQMAPCSPPALPPGTAGWPSSACFPPLVHRKTSHWPPCVWGQPVPGG